MTNDGDDEDRAALQAALIQASGGRAVLQTSPDLARIEARAAVQPVIDIVRAGAAVAVAEAPSDCDDAVMDLASLTECKLSVEGRARLARHLDSCTHCLELATSIADAMEAERKERGVDPSRGPRGGVGGSA